MKKLKKMTQEQSIRFKNYLSENGYTEKYVADLLEISTATVCYACRQPERVSHTMATLLMNMVDGNQKREKEQIEKLPESKHGTLYHVANLCELDEYNRTGVIHCPDGFTTFFGVVANAMRFGGVAIIKVSGTPLYKCQRRHNKYGEHWWIDQDVTEWSVEVSTREEEENVAMQGTNHPAV